MELGITLPHMGRYAGASALIKSAQLAEQLGYSAVWAADRLLYPLQPKSRYPVTADGSLPEFYKTVLDPIETLTFVAAHTYRIRLGTSVLDIPFYNPVTLARRLTTLDVLSKGRLNVGFGMGWSADEFEAAGDSSGNRGARADEFLQALKTIWTNDPVEFSGKYFRIPRAIIGPKPVQKPHPPIYLAAYVPAALSRAARLANGWMPVGIPLDNLSGMIKQLRQMAAEYGRKDEPEVILGAAFHITSAAGDKNRPDFTGSLLQIKEDIRRAEAMGIGKMFCMLSPDLPTENVLREISELRELMQ